MLTILFDGVAYGMLLFVLACGLSVTLGLMNFINLAHGAFAMAGGYCTVILVNRFGVPFALGLPIAFLVTAMLGGLFERTLYVTSMPAAISTRCCSPSGSSSCRSRRSTTSWARRSNSCRSRRRCKASSMCSASAWANIACSSSRSAALLTIALQLMLAKTRFGSRLRAAVDDQRVARGLGINVGAVFARHLCVRLRPRRPGRRARRRNPRASIRPSRSNT